jgi:O-antigen/teichoic acid export membrane protein
MTADGRAGRLFAGWSANLVQMGLGAIQQVLLVPVFLHFWTSDVLAAWLAVYAAGSLVLVADAGLQLRAINRFLAFKSSIDRDGRTASFYAGMRRIYFGLAATLALLLVFGARLLAPSAVLGFPAVSDFDAAFLVMTVGAVLSLPSNLVSGLYRARGQYGRAVWLQNAAMLLAQLAQLFAVVAIGSLLSVAVAYAAIQLALTLYLVAVDAPRLFPFLHGGRGRRSWRWSIGQFGPAFPFAIAGITELTLLNAPVLLVSALVSDRIAVAQWALTRVAAGLLRGLCIQVTLPVAAELGYDHAIGDKERLRRLYARGSVLVTALASLIVSGLLPFWPDFFALWTHGSVPYDAPLTITLLIGTGIVAPSLLALGFANYSNRGDLLARSKGLQLVVFLVLSVVLIRTMGPLGAAIALVVSDLSIQFGVLALTIVRQTLRHPLRHLAFLALLAIVIVLPGWGIGYVITSSMPGSGLLRFVGECVLWLAAMGLVASPLASSAVRDRLARSIPD